MHGERNAAFGRRYGIFVLLLIAVLSIVREAFLCVTASNAVRVGQLSVIARQAASSRIYLQQNQATLFYPLAASPEFVAAILFLVPGLVPSKDELKARMPQNNAAYAPQSHAYGHRQGGSDQLLYAPYA